MTTAHRPTWNPAQGGSQQGGNRGLAPSRVASAKDMPGHLTLKVRKPGQGTKAEVSARDLIRELQERERKLRKGGEAEAEQVSLEPPTKLPRLGGTEEDPQSDLKKRLFEQDADEPAAESDSDSDDGEDPEGPKPLEDSDGDDDDDDQELLRELERIKKERAEEQARKEREAETLAAQRRTEDLLTGNPLLNPPSDFTLKRRWDDDTVFKHQSRKHQEKKREFVNDTIRNDFHRNFLKKYIK